MTSPRKQPIDVFAVDPVSKANWLGRYLPVEIKAIKAIEDALKDAEKSIAKTLEASVLWEEPNISTGIRRAQLNLNMGIVRKTLTEVFGSVTNIIRDHQSEAALAAIDAGFFDDRKVMSKLFPNPSDRQNFTNSFKKTAERNVQAMMTRILGTQQPLSKRVWKTRALSQGYVDRAVNNALARGDSYKNLAKSVEHLVNPATPGGISYAAKRLARTEINNAFHAQSISDVQEKPWVDSASWNLSKRHVEDPGDLCEVYALQIHFPKTQVPKKPHPHCRCFITPDLMDYDTFEDQLIQGVYDPYLDEVMGNEKEQDKEVAKQITSIAKQKVDQLPEPEFLKPLSPKTFGIDAATKPEHVAEYLSRKHPQVTFMGWNKKNVTLEAAKQYGQALDEMLEQFPDNGLDVVSFGVNPEIEYGRTYMAPNGRSMIIFNKHYSLDVNYTNERMTHDVRTHFHVKRSDEAPYYQTAIHEFGHVLDAYTGLQARKNAIQDLATALAESDFEVSGKGFNEWFDANMVDYCFKLDDDGNKKIDFTESTAEAFADVILNGDEASPISQILFDHLLSAKITGAKQFSGFFSESKAVKKSDYARRKSLAKSSITIERPELRSFEDVTSASDAAFLLQDYDIAPVGIDETALDPLSAKELIEGVEKLVEKYPHVELTEIRLKQHDRTNYATTFPSTIIQDKDGNFFAWKSYVEFNLWHTRDYENFRNTMQMDEDARFHPPGSGAKPVLSTFNHEFGHAMVNSLGRDAPIGIDMKTALIKYYSKNVAQHPRRPGTNATNKAINNYIKRLDDWEVGVLGWLKQLSRYSFVDYNNGVLDRDESLAEAFDEVERLGNKASEPAKVLHDLLVEAYHKRYDKIDLVQKRRTEKFIKDMRKRKEK